MRHIVNFSRVQGHDEIRKSGNYGSDGWDDLGREEIEVVEVAQVQNL